MGARLRTMRAARHLGTGRVLAAVAAAGIGISSVVTAGAAVAQSPSGLVSPRAGHGFVAEEVDATGPKDHSTPARQINDSRGPGDRDSFGNDHDGYDVFGRDQFGRDRFGRDRSGYDRDGYDSFGRDSFGRDRQGYDRSGRDRFGRDRFGNDQDRQAPAPAPFPTGSAGG